MTATLAAADRRFMAAAIRLSERHVGCTGTNPSVGAILVRIDGGDPILVGRGVTACGGRPHAEAIALAEAGGLARGATAYVTLEPCAHHGRTPPCADALVRAGVARVVYAMDDPDPRVSGRGQAILRDAGLLVEGHVMREEARAPLSGYLNRVARKRPQVTLKMAVSRDGKIGLPGRGQIMITGPVANAQTHLLRARHDAILVGIDTVLEDDPALTCRLPGLEGRSPLRIVLDARLRTPLDSTLVRTARATPVALAVAAGHVAADRALFQRAGCEFIDCETEPGASRIRLDLMLDGLAAKGMSSLLVEGGARTARAFLDHHLVDRIVVIRGDIVIGDDGLDAPFDRDHLSREFETGRTLRFGPDLWTEYEKRGS